MGQVRRRRRDGPGLLALLVGRVRQSVQAQGDRLILRPTTGWVALRGRRARRVFAEVRTHRWDVEAFILPPRADLKEGAHLAQEAPSTQGWGWFQSKFRIREDGDLEAAHALLLQSYTVSRQRAPRRSPRPRGQRRLPT